MSVCVHTHEFACVYTCTHVYVCVRMCVCVCVHMHEREREREREICISQDGTYYEEKQNETNTVLKLHSQVTYQYYLFCSKDLQNHCILIHVETDVVQMLDKNTDLHYCAVFVQQFLPVCPYTGKV